MKSRILLLSAALIGLGSCSTMYKSGQTPDDVYYSPAPQYRTASSDNDENGNYSGNGNDEYVNVQTDQDRLAYNSEDNYLRMKVRNRTLWSTFDAYSMYDGFYSPYFGGGFGMGYYNPYSYYNSFYHPYSFYSPSSYYGNQWGLGLGWGGLYSGWGNFYNPYYSSFYNPYYGSGIYYPGTGKPGTVTRPANSYGPRTYNLSRYGTTSNGEQINGNNGNRPRRVFGNNNNNYVTPGRSSSESYSPRRSSGSGSDSRPSRTIFDSPRSNNSSPSYTPSSSGSSGGGGSAPSRPGRH